MASLFWEGYMFNWCKTEIYGKYQIKCPNYSHLCLIPKKYKKGAKTDYDISGLVIY